MADALDRGARGRARSNSMHGELDDDFAHDIDSVNATIEGKEPPPPPKRSSSAEGKRAAGALSKKTIAMLTDLEIATATPPELAGGRAEETEEEKAERELAHQERKRRAALEGSGAAGGDGASAPAAATGGSGSAGVKMLGPAARGKGKADDKDIDVVIKLLLLGDSGVGKTSLMTRYSEDKFSTSLLSTAGVDYQSQLLEVEGKKVKCQIWDTAGQQRFHVITQAYYKGAHGIVLVYDVSDPTESSFNNVRYWMENIKKHANSHTLRILIGNKIDVKGKKIESARGKALADEFGMQFFETSAKDGTGVKESFHSLARDIVTKMIAAGMLNTPAAGAAGGAGAGAGAAGAAAGGAAAGGKKEKDKDCVVQ